MKVICELTKHDVSHVFWENNKMFILPTSLRSMHFKDFIREQWSSFDVVYFLDDDGNKIKIK